MKADTTGLPDSPSTELRLVGEVGNEHFGHGLTRLELTADGACTVVNRRPGAEEVREHGKVDPDWARRLVRRLESPSQVAPAAPRKGPGTAAPKPLPDEPRYRLAVMAGDRRLETVEVWRSQLAGLPELQALVEDLQRVVAEVAARKVIF